MEYIKKRIYLIQISIYMVQLATYFKHTLSSSGWKTNRK